MQSWKTFTLHCTVKRSGKHFCRMIFFFKNIYTYSWKVEGYTNILGLIEFPIFFTGLFQISIVVVLVAKLCPTLGTPWTVALQAPLFMEFSRREYWSGLPFNSYFFFFFFFAIYFSRGSSQSRGWTHVSCVGSWSLYWLSYHNEHVLLLWSEAKLKQLFIYYLFEQNWLCWIFVAAWAFL